MQVFTHESVSEMSLPLFPEDAGELLMLGPSFVMKLCQRHCEMLGLLSTEEPSKLANPACDVCEKANGSCSG